MLSITQLLRGWAGITTQASRHLASDPLLPLGAHTLVGEDAMRNHSEDSGRYSGYCDCVGLLGTSSKQEESMQGRQHPEQGPR